MAVSASVVDGILNQTVNDTSKSKASGSSLDKDAFLQLLVAQMKYQDPLEPTSNTEYISQFATFSELEQMQNLASTSELQRASSLVGKTVIIESVSATGNITQIYGKVDYVVYENNKALVGVNGGEYSLDEVSTVVDEEFVEARDMAVALLTAVNKLPSVANISLDSEDAINSIKEVYEGMNEYQLSFLSDENKTLIESYITKLEEVKKIAAQPVETILASLNELPDVSEVTSENEKVINAIQKLYADLTEYQLGLLGDSNKEKVESYIAKLKEVLGEQ